MSKVGLILLWFGFMCAVAIAFITTGAALHDTDAEHYFAAPLLQVLKLFYQQTAIAYLGFTTLATLWEGTQLLWPRYLDRTHRMPHYNHLPFYVVIAGLVIGTMAGFVALARSPSLTTPIASLSMFFSQLAYLSLPFSIAGIVYASQRYFRHPVI